MSQQKVYEVAKELGMETIALMDKIRGWKLPVKSHMATLDDELVKDILERLRSEAGKKKKAPAKKKAAAKKKVASSVSKAGTKKVAKNAVKKAVKKASAKDAPEPVKTATKGKVAKAGATKAGAAKKIVVRKTVIRRTAASIQAAEDTIEVAKVAKVSEDVKPVDLQAEAKAFKVNKIKEEARELAEAQETLKSSLGAAEAEISTAADEPDAKSAKPDVQTDDPKVDEALQEQTLTAAVLPEEKSVKEKKEEPEKKIVAKPRRNIVGKMDLKRVRPSGPPSKFVSSGGRPKEGSAARNAAPQHQRNIRTGFVSTQVPDTPPPVGTAEGRNKKGGFTRVIVPPKKPAQAAGGKELPVTGFQSADFRKREVIFQPKRKKPVSGGLMRKTEITTPKALKRVVKVPGTLSVSELAIAIGLKVPKLIRALVSNGVTANMNSVLDFDTISLVLPELGFEAKNVALDMEDLVAGLAFGNTEAEAQTRAPVVTVMGHVDHGKTSLLDAIRKTDVVKGESGGITQHIGAYQVTLKGGGNATFIDTPGHAAFTNMRMRGATVTDIVILVVAADDGVMPQTQEAIGHAKAAGVPIIVAINKMDRPNASPDKIKQQLTEYELLSEDWGGSTIFCEISALKNQGIDELMEQVMVQAEVLDLKSNAEVSASGSVIESRVVKGKGNVASLLVQAGTLRIGDSLVLGKVVSRVRNMTDSHGKKLKEATPSMAVEITALPTCPDAGDRFDVTLNDDVAKAVAKRRIDDEAKANVDTRDSSMSIEELFANVKSDDKRELPIILKVDVGGSIEAIRGMLEELGTDEVSVKIIHKGVGAVSESDVLLAAVSGAKLFGFGVGPDPMATKLSKVKDVKITMFKIIYELVDEIKDLLSGLLKPTIIEKIEGKAEVRQIFSVPKIGTIAGCFVVDGKIGRSHRIRIMRAGSLVFEGELASLKRFKDDAKEVGNGYECGLSIEKYNDLKVGDELEAFSVEEKARTL